MNQRFFSSARSSINLNDIEETHWYRNVYFSYGIIHNENIIFNIPKSCFRQGEFLRFVPE